MLRSLLEGASELRHRAAHLIDDRRWNASVIEPSILVLRHLSKLGDYQFHYLKWLRELHPDLAARIHLARLAPRMPRLDSVRLLVPWLQDPLRERFQRQFRWEERIEAECAERGISVVNPATSLSMSLKSKALPAIRSVGIRTAQVERLDRTVDRETISEKLPFPFLVREDHLHGTPMWLVHSEKDLAEVRWHRLRHPIALEWIDVQNDDGFCRKYRYVVVGDAGVPRHLVISRHWHVHVQDRVLSEANRQEELKYTAGDDRNHPLLLLAARRLGFDVVAFDYSYDREDRLVVWEPNPLATFWAFWDVPEVIAYQVPSFTRLYIALTRYYFHRAGLADLIGDRFAKP